jgi:hypothetical protein
MASWAHGPEESEERTQERDTGPHQDGNGAAAHRQVRSQEVRKICIEGEEGLDWVVLTRARNLLVAKMLKAISEAKF